MNVLILGVNGFIGSHLTRRILARTSWNVFGMDMATSRLGKLVHHDRFRFIEGDITINKSWVEYHLKKSDVVIPLVAIATPALYIRKPLEVFELGFEANLHIVRLCDRYGKRLVFPSSSEVYGMADTPEFNEETTPLVYGPIHKQRWIYACSKQLMDRVIHAYGLERRLNFTCFRPFNWIGPGLDDIRAAKEGSSRVVTQFINNLLTGIPIHLIDGGIQTRCYTWIDDGIDALMRILQDPDGRCYQEIFNIGNPKNECSVENLAKRLIKIYNDKLKRSSLYVKPEIEVLSSQKYYGKGYEDIPHRKPSIAKATEILGWKPKVGLETALKRTFEAALRETGMLRKRS